MTQKGWCKQISKEKIVLLPTKSDLEDVVEEVEDSELESTQDISLKKRFLNVQTLVSFGVAFAIIYFLLTRADIDVAGIVQDVSQANPIYFLMGFLVYYLSFPLRGIRWRLLLQNAGLHEDRGTKIPSFLGLAEIILLAWFANCLVPAKLGDAFRGYLLKKSARVSFSKTMGTVLAERIVDIVVLFALMATAAISIIRSSNSQTAVGIIQIGLVLMAILAVGLVGMRFMGGFIQRFIPLKFREIYERFEHGTLHSFQQLPLVAVISVLVWGCEVARLYFVVLSLGITVPPAMIIFVSLASSLLTTVPFTPGGLGLVEAGVVGVLMIAVNKGDAVSIAVLDRTISYWSIIVIGFFFYIFNSRRR